MKNKKEHFRSRGLILATVISVIILGVLWWIVKGPVFVNFFQNQKVSSMIEAYETINGFSNRNKLGTEEFNEAFQALVEKNNFNIIIKGAYSETLLASSRDYESMAYDLMGYVFGILEKDKDEVIKVTEDYEIYLRSDSQTSAQYIDMWGTLDNGDVFLMRSSMEGLRENVETAEMFFTFILIVLTVTVVAGLIVFSRHTVISRLREKNNELMRDIRQKEEMEKMRTEFISSLSHELKTPIALIQGYAEGLAEGVTCDEESKAYYCEVIRDEANHMNDVVQKMIRINHIEFDKNDIHYEKFDIVEAIRDIIISSAILYESKGITIEMDDYPPIWVISDKQRIEEAFDNYFTNAVHYVKNENLIRVGIKRSGNGTTVSVYNSGDLIPEEAMGHLFEKFYKVDKARTREYGGSGVGLSIVKAIMDSLEGNCEVRNLENGVEFRFTIIDKEELLENEN